MRRIPIIPTLVVLAAVAVMIRLGFWQLDRMEQKQLLIDQYQHAMSSTTVSDLGHDLLIDGPGEYNHVRLECLRPIERSMQAGHNARGESGWAHVVLCEFQYNLRGTQEAEVVIGWSRAPAEVNWAGGEISGVVVPSRRFEPIPNNGGTYAYLRVVADPPLAGLEANAKPDPRNIPNNHWSYAIQWFLFAATALVIYALALRKRLNPPRNGEGDHPQDGGGVGS
jgi:surfeit locus 1 family protein